MSYYNDNFYLNQVSQSLDSARFYAEILTELIRVDSIIDIGCGRGAWLAAFDEKIQHDCYFMGVEGPWNKRSDMVIKNLNFLQIDLNEIDQLNLDRKFSLCISVEVLEHLLPKTTEMFINKLCESSDVVLFSAAYKNQGGINHINERVHSDWFKFFERNSYEVYDLFREKLWDNQAIQVWHRQNIFLYVRNHSDVSLMLKSKGIKPMVNPSFMNCVHPELYSKRISFSGFIKYKVMKFLPQKLSVAIDNIKKMSK